jgi:D-3-phosphoglycerate dehydrogenase
MKGFLSIRSSGTINAEEKLVITDYEVDSLKLEQGIFSGSDVEFITAQCRTEDEVIRAASDADGILNQYAPISSRVIESL